MTSTDFWAALDQQVTELRTAHTADDVMRIVAKERNPYGYDNADANASGFFAGEGGDMLGALDEAGWTTVRYNARYYWVSMAPNGDLITYVEGDVYRGNTMLPSGDGNDV